MLCFEKGLTKMENIKHDPIEENPELKKIINKAEKEAENKLISCKRRFGYCRLLWLMKKQILKEKYKINWKSPIEMNPEIDFD